MGLIERSIKILEDEIGLQKLRNAGFTRDPTKYYIVSTYPPVSIAKKTSERDVFSNIEQRKNAALYFHIPFCSRSCTFCPYFKIPDNRKIKKYIQALKKELELAKKYIDKSCKVSAIYIGGGSPTFLKPEQLDDLLAFIHRKIDLPKSAEITVEVHPEISQKEPDSYIEILKKNNVNRISIGIQTFNDDILHSVNRGHTSKQAIELYRKFRKAEFPYINIDLLNGLRDQTISTWKRDLETAYDLNPDCITTYYMGIRNWTETYKQYRKEPHRFPNEYMQHLFAIMASEMARHDNRKETPILYSAKSRDHFRYLTDIYARPEEAIYIGLGLSSHSYVNGWQYFNHTSIEKYFKSINDGKLPIWKGTKLAFEDRITSTIMFNLRFLNGINKKKFRSFFGEDITNRYGKTIDLLIALGLLCENEKNVHLTRAGTLFAEEICNLFLPLSRIEKLKGPKEIYDRFYWIE